MSFAVNNSPNASAVSAASSGMGVAEQMMMVLMERHTVLEAQVMVKVTDMRAKNAELQKAGKFTAGITKMINSMPSSPKNTDKPSDGEMKNQHHLACHLDGKVFQLAKVGHPKAQDLNMTTAQEMLQEAANANKAGTPLEKLQSMKAEVDRWEAAGAPAALTDIYKGNISLAESALERGMSSNSPNQDVFSIAKGDVQYGALDTLKVQTKATTDAIGNDTHLDQIELQSLNGKLQNLASLMSTLLKSHTDTSSGIIQKT